MRERKMSAAAERMRELLEDIRDHKEYSILYMMVVSCISRLKITRQTTDCNK